MTASDVERLRELLARIHAASSGELSGVACDHGWDRTVCPMRGCGDDLDEMLTEFLAGAQPLLEAATRVKVLEEALRPFAHLQMPARCEGNAAFYSVLHSDLRRARTALTASEDDRGSKGEGRG